MNQRTADYVRDYKERNPEYKEYSDGGVYRILEGKGHEFPEGIEYARETPVSENSSPGLIASMADYWITEDSYDWTKEAYNRSLTGTLEQVMTGKKRYEDVNPHDLDWAEDIGATALSFLMPVDFLAMWTGGKVGGMVGKSLIGKSSAELAEVGLKGLSIGERAILGASGQSAALGLYEGSMGGMQAHLNGEDVMSGAAEGVFHGAILGGITGAIGGSMAYKHSEVLAKGLEKKGKDVSKSLSWGEDRLAKTLWGIPGQIGAESGVFTAAEQVERAHAGEDIDAKSVLTSFAKNIALFSVLKTQGKLQEKSIGKMKEFRDNARKEALEDWAKQKESESVDNVNERVKELSENDKEFSQATEKITKDLETESGKKKDKEDKVKSEIDEAIERAETTQERIKLESFDEGNPEHVADAINSLGEQSYILKKHAEWLNKRSKDFDKGSEKYTELKQREKDALANAQQIDLISKTINKKATGRGKNRGELIGEAEELGVKTIPSEIPGKDIPVRKATAEQLDAYLEGRRKASERTRKKHTPLSEDADFKVETTEKFVKEKKKIKFKTKEQEKEYHERIDEFAKIDKEIVESEGGFEKGSKERGKYEQNKGIVRHFIQEILPNLMGTTVAKGYVKAAKSYARQIDSFSKWLAERGKTFKDVANNDLQAYLAENPTHVSSIQRVREFLQNNQITKKGALTIGQKETKGYAISHATAPPEGARVNIDTHTISADGFTFRQPKTKKTITKWISGKLKTLIRRISKATEGEGHLFKDKDGNVLNNSTVNKITDILFGDKGLKDKARLLRDSFSSWVGKKYGGASKEEIAVLAEILGDKSALSAVEKSYNKAEMGTLANKLLKDYLKEINNGGKIDKSAKEYYSTREIAKGLKKIGELEVNGKIISKDTVEALARYMIETSPRVNEIVPSSKKQAAKFQLEKDIKGETARIEVLKEQKSFFENIPAYKALEIIIRKTLGKFQGENVLGKIRGHMIEVAEGRAKIDTIPHEISHHVVDILNAIGSNKSKLLIKRGTELFGRGLTRKKGESLKDFTLRKEEKFVQAIGEYSAGLIKNRSLYNRAKEWVKRFTSEVKNAFGMAGEADITRIMADKVIKGKLETTNPIEIIKNFSTKHQTDGTSNPEGRKYRKALQDKVVEETKKLRRLGHTEKDIQEIRQLHFGDKLIWNAKEKRFTFKFKDITTGEMEAYYENITKKVGTNTGSRSKKIHELNKQYQITENQSRELLEALGVRDGNPDNIKAFQVMSQYEKFVKEYGIESQVHDNTMDNIIALDKGIKKPIMSFMMIASHVLGKMGKPGKILQKKMNDFDFMHNYIYKGKGDLVIENVTNLLGKDKDNFWMFDREMREVYLGKRDATPKEKKFMEALEDGYIEFEHIKTGEKIKVKGSEALEHKLRLNEEYQVSDAKGSNVFMAGNMYRHLTETYWRDLYSIGEKHHNRVEFEDFKKEFNQKFVTGYMSRRVTRDVKEYIESTNILDKHMEEIYVKAIKQRAKERALKNIKLQRKPKETEREFLNRKIKHKKYNKEYENALVEEKLPENADKLKEEILEDLYNVIQQKHYKVKNRYLMERSPLLPEYIKITKNGKEQLVKTYETEMKHVLDPYVSSMSKYLTTVSLFPEWTNIGGKYTVGSSKAQLMKTQIADSEMGQYAETAIKRLIGAESVKIGEAKVSRVGQAISNFSAIVGLSSPTSGLKNLMIGMPRNMASFGVRRTWKAMRKLNDPETWIAARRKGALEYGSKHHQLSEQYIPHAEFMSMEKVFTWNQMTRTENWNRIVAMEAGKMYFNETIGQLRGEGGVFGQWKGKLDKGRIRDTMKEMWRLTEADIVFLEKADFSKESNAKRLEGLQAVVEHWSHVSSQGGTSVGQLPLWMSNHMVKPLVLFQRFAASVTWDTYRNYVRPVYKHGNVAPLLTAVAGQGLSGWATYEMYKYFFDQQPPKAGGDKLDKAIMYLHRGEMLGVFNDIWSPYQGEGQINPLMKPVILRNMEEAYKNFSAWAGNGKTLKQATGDWAKKTVVVWGQADKLYKNSQNKDYKNAKRLGTMAREFKQEHEIVTPAVELLAKQAPYYRDLKESILFGDNKNIEKSYWAAHNMLVVMYAKNYPTMTQRMRIKKAKKAIDSSLRSMNPIRFSKERKGYKHGVSQRAYFLSWIRERMGEETYAMALDAEKKFMYKSRRLDSIIKNGRDKYSAFL